MMRAPSPSRLFRQHRTRCRLATLAVFGVLAAGPRAALAGPEPLARMPAPPGAPAVQELIDEASRRFGVPVAWITQVMQVESRGHTNALSPKGAIGLMQVMPETYAALAARYGLGADPWNPRDNVLAGAAYLRELYDRYGAPGFLVAYNAGPGRWDDYRLLARPLPAETVAYLARLGSVIGGSALPVPAFAGSTALRPPLAASIFVRLASVPAPAPVVSERERIVRIIEANATIVGRPSAIFVPRPRAADVLSDVQSSDHRASEQSPSGRPAPVPGPVSSPSNNPLFPDRANAGARR